MKCIFGILDNERGLKIANEMKKWLSTKYEIIECHHDGSLFEYPAIKMASEMNEPVLYIHTKGAGNDNGCQPIIRNFWKRQFIDNYDKYIIELNSHDVVCPFSGKEKHTWYNGFMTNPKAFDSIRHLLVEPNPNRYFYEDMWIGTDTDVFGIVSNEIDHTTVHKLGGLLR